MKKSRAELLVSVFLEAVCLLVRPELLCSMADDAHDMMTHTFTR